MLWEFKTGNMTLSGAGGEGFHEEVMFKLIALEWWGSNIGKGKWSRMFHSERTVHAKVQRGNVPL